MPCYIAGFAVVPGTLTIQHEECLCSAANAYHSAPSLHLLMVRGLQLQHLLQFEWCLMQHLSSGLASLGLGFCDQERVIWPAWHMSNMVAQGALDCVCQTVAGQGMIGTCVVCELHKSSLCVAVPNNNRC